MKIYDKIFINGVWVQPSGQDVIDIESASTQEIIARIPAAEAEDARLAVEAARGAFPDWSATTPQERAVYLDRIGAQLKERSAEIGETIAHEVGMPLMQAIKIQAGSPRFTFASYSKLLTTFEWQQQVGNSTVYREPVGVVVCITPWNYPLHQIAAKVAPALAAGCTVVLKPSEVAPLNAFIFAEIIASVGLPKGVFNMVTGYGATVGEALVSSPDADMVSFTGSTRSGTRVAELAAATVKRVALELGGKSAAIVLQDADLTQAVKATVSTCFLNSGQTCSAHTRLLVHESQYEEAAALAKKYADAYVVGSPLDEATTLGPVISHAQRERVRSYINKGIEEGAELIAGGPESPAGLDKGYYVQPTVFGRVDPLSTIAQEEIFGPVLSIITYRNLDEAVEIANGTPFGLAGAVWSADEDKAVGVALRLRTGQVDINGGQFNMLAPFGGYKQSGYGRELGKFGLDEFLEFKSVQFKR
ncbi:aldehyde dehydrogenase family protein [Pollutimonas bauzanensis]|uniref:aldehyde dehydrogenase family protein n=1 Tax=Pollutimonas bauzanensis TaxID=658167 RepID=UPI00333E54A1